MVERAQGEREGAGKVLFHVLGPLEVHCGTSDRRTLTGKPATLLATLLLQPNAWVSAETLADAIWPERVTPLSGRPSARANLKTYVWQLRRLLPPHDGGPRIEGRRGAYRVRVGPGELDSQRFAELAADARRAAADGCPGAAAPLLDQALRLWHGRPFDGLDTAASRAVLQWLEELRWEMRELLADAQTALGRHADAVAVLRSVVAEAPLREGTWARLVDALHASGLPEPAVTAYRQARQILHAELGVEPGPALAGAYRRVVGAPPVARARQELPRDVPLNSRAGELAAVLDAARGPAPVVLIDGQAPGRVRRTRRGAAAAAPARTPPGRPGTPQGGQPLLTHAGIEAALSAAARDVLVTSSSYTAGGLIGTLRSVDYDNLRRGVRYRVLFPDRARGIPVLATRLRSLALAGGEVRTLPEVPMDATVVDEMLALLPGEQRDARAGGVALFRLPSVVGTIVELFELVWPSAVPLVATGAPAGTELTERERELLALLSAGCTDESAAARLGVSVRTVRRLMSTIMDRLGARSRFQAGMKAADRGWLAQRAG